MKEGRGNTNACFFVFFDLERFAFSAFFFAIFLVIFGSLLDITFVDYEKSLFCPQFPPETKISDSFFLSKFHFFGQQKCLFYGDSRWKKFPGRDENFSESSQQKVCIPGKLAEDYMQVEFFWVLFEFTCVAYLSCVAYFEGPFWVPPPRM